VNILTQYRLSGRTAREISASVEAGVRGGQLTPGNQLPPVRELAGQLGVSPTTVAAAYAELRTPWGRSEAYADLVQRAGHDSEPATGPLPPIADCDPRADGLPRHPLAAVLEFPARIRYGRPGHLLLRAVIAAALALVVLQLIPGTTAAPADITGVITWFVLTGRRDLAPPPER